MFGFNTKVPIPAFKRRNANFPYAKNSFCL